MSRPYTAPVWPESNYTTVVTGVSRPRLLDLFSGAGGAAMGYHRAGFEVVGVDVRPQPHYPFEFHEADAFDVLRRLLTGEAWQGFTRADFAAIHGSPTCQRWTAMASLHPELEHPDQITPLRTLLQETGLPWVVENVPGAPLLDPVLICGSMFDPPMDVRRHRLFENDWGCRPPQWPCRHKLWAPRFPSEHLEMKRRGRLSRVVGVYGGGRYKGSDRLREQAMGIDWMRREELSQAIPPAYTEWIGGQLMAHLRAAA